MPSRMLYLQNGNYLAVDQITHVTRYAPRDPRGRYYVVHFSNAVKIDIYEYLSSGDESISYKRISEYLLMMKFELPSDREAAKNKD